MTNALQKWGEKALEKTRLKSVGTTPHIKNVCVVGAGNVGAPTATIIASKWRRVKITVADNDQTRIDAWKSRNPPIAEPGLAELIQICCGRRKPNICFSSNVQDAIEKAEMVMVAVSTPAKINHDKFPDLDISSIIELTDLISRTATSDKTIIIKSTVPVGTSRMVSKRLNEGAYPGVRFDVLYCPEFLAAGTAIDNLLHPNRVVIGFEQTQEGKRAMQALATIYEKWVPASKLVAMDTASAEITKLASNALLAQRVSSINALAVLCEREGADVGNVSLACGLDVRIGPNMLKASLGFSGPCLEKDVAALSGAYQKHGLNIMASYWTGINHLNVSRAQDVALRILKQMPKLRGEDNPRIAVLGAAFKDKTVDIRGSPVFALLASILSVRTNVEIALFDPNMSPSELRMAIMAHFPELWLNFGHLLQIFEDAQDACAKASVVIVATSQIKHCKTRNAQPLILDTQNSYLNWAAVALDLRAPKYVFDAHNAIDAAQLAELGLRVDVMGKGEWQSE